MLRNEISMHQLKRHTKDILPSNMAYSQQVFGKSVLGNTSNEEHALSLSRSDIVGTLQRNAGNSYMSSLVAGSAKQEALISHNNQSTNRSKSNSTEMSSACVANQDKPGRIQTKLEIGPSNDRYEQEADRVANDVVRMSAPLASSKTKTPSADTGIQRISSMDNITHGSTTDLNIDQKGGQPLSLSTRQYMEPRFGVDFSNVRMHTDRKSQHDAAQIQAKAFTYGNHIWLAKGESEQNKFLMAHELTHTVQQGFSGNQMPLINRKKIQTTKPKIQMSKNVDVAVYETKDHGTGYEDAPSETFKLKANSLKEAGARLNALLGVIRNVFGSSSAIKKLSFYGHAAPGSQSVGAGESWDPAKEISVASIDAYPDEFKKIYTPLSNGADVYMRGCNAGADAAGLGLMNKIQSSCKSLVNKDIQAHGWTGSSYHMRVLAYDWYKQTGQLVSSGDKAPKISWDKLKKRGKKKK